MLFRSTAAFVVRGFQTTVCIVVAAYAWIPGVANPAQWIIIGAFIIEAVLIQELSSKTQFIHYSE